MMMGNYLIRAHWVKSRLHTRTQPRAHKHMYTYITCQYLYVRVRAVIDQRARSQACSNLLFVPNVCMHGFVCCRGRILRFR